MGNKVYFLNSPSTTSEMKFGEVVVEPTEHSDLYEVRHRFFYPYVLKHKVKWLHRFLLKFHLKKVFREIGSEVDVVWSFDISDTVSLRSFHNKAYKIFMPVDEPSMPDGLGAAKSANVIFSVTNEILDKYSSLNIPMLFTNHGVSSVFFKRTDYKYNTNNIKVGLSGNFLRPEIDWQTLTKIIEAHSHVEFNFYGPVFGDKTNLLEDTNAQTEQVDLSRYNNIKLHGAVASEVLSNALHDMDAFLICYDIDKDQSGGTNYHKVLEYMATGRVIISNNITTYQNQPGLIEMPVERNNTKLAELFSTVVSNLELYNSTERQQERIKYANSHTYENNIMSIENFITKAKTRP